MTESAEVELIVQEVLRSGRKVGVLYEPTSEEVEPDLRVFRDLQGRVKIRRASGVDLGFKVAWSFDAEAFRKFIRILNAWSVESDDLAGYRSIRSGMRGIRDLYHPPGEGADPFDIQRDDADLRELTREDRRVPHPCGLHEEARYRNGRGHAVARVFRWEALRVYWTRIEMVVVGRFDPDPPTEDLLIDYTCFGVTSPGGRRRKCIFGGYGPMGEALDTLSPASKWLPIHYDERVYLNEVAIAVGQVETTEESVPS